MSTEQNPEYLIAKAQLAQTRDPYEAKAWIITAKTLYPQDFFVQYAAFEQEKLEVGKHTSLMLLERLLTI